ALAAEAARGADGQRRMATSLIAVAAILAVAATVTTILSNIAHQTFWGVHAELLSATAVPPQILYAARATAVETNLFASFLLIPFTLALWAWHREGGGQQRLVAALGAIAFGLVFAVTRAAWLAMVVIIVLWYWVRRPRWQQVAGLGLILALAFVI